MIVRARSALSCLLFLCLALVASCGSSSRLAALRDVHTEQDEARVLGELWRRARDDHAPLSFSAVGKDGAQISLSEEKWWTRAERVVIRIDREQMDYKVLKGENLLVLMGE